MSVVPYPYTGNVSPNDPGAASVGFLRKRADRTLHPNLEFFPHASKALLESHNGLKIYIPEWNDIAAASTTIDPNTLKTAQTFGENKREGFIRWFGEVVQISRLDQNARTLGGQVEEIVEQKTVGLAKSYDNEILFGPTGNDGTPDPFDANNDGILRGAAVVPGTERWLAPTPSDTVGSEQPMYESADQATNYGDTVGTTKMIPKSIIAARRRLRKNDVQRFSNLNNKYCGIFTVDAVFDAITNQSDLNFERASMNQTDVFKTNHIGDLGDVAIVESSYSELNVTSTAVNQFGANAASENLAINFVFGAGAFWASDLENMRPEVIIHGFGSAGSADGLNQFMSVGVCGAMGIVLGKIGTRLVVIPSGQDTA